MFVVRIYSYLMVQETLEPVIHLYLANITCFYLAWIDLCSWVTGYTIIVLKRISKRFPKRFISNKMYKGLLKMEWGILVCPNGLYVVSFAIGRNTTCWYSGGWFQIKPMWLCGKHIYPHVNIIMYVCIPHRYIGRIAHDELEHTLFV